MNNVKHIFTLLLLLLAFVGNANAQDADAKYATSLLQPGTTAPDFTLNTLKGKPFSLKSLRGHYVVLDFWASWCPDCRKDIPALVSLHRQYGKTVKFVSVSFDDKRSNWANCVAANKMAWTHVSELKKWKETAISPLYGIKWLPSIYVLDRQGNVILATVMIDKVAQKLKELHEL